MGPWCEGNRIMVLFVHHHDKKILQALEWDRLIEQAEENAYSEPGAEVVGQLLNSENWAQDVQSAREMQNETQEILPLLDRDSLWNPLMDLTDPFEVFDALDR